jgi:hypothetical protein
MQEIIVVPFEGTSAQLLAKVKPADPEWKPPKGWPKDARAVTGRMRRLAPAFRKTGWAIEDLGSDNHAKLLRWKVSPAEPTEESRKDAREPPQDPHRAGNAGMGGDDSGPSTSAGQKKKPACPRHQTPFGARKNCPDCEALATRETQ